jgi:hypothetical protein
MHHAWISSYRVSIFAVDMENIALVRIFEGGTRIPVPEDTWVYQVSEDQILLNIGGGGMVRLDLQVALDAVLDEE